VEEQFQHTTESEDGSSPSKALEGDVALRSVHSGVSLLPWNGLENFQEGPKIGTVNELFSDADLLDRDEEVDLENGREKHRSLAAKRTFKDRLEVWKWRWNEWVLERRRKLCVGGERSGSLLVVEDSSISSTEEGLISERRRSSCRLTFFRFHLVYPCRINIGLYDFFLLDLVAFAIDVSCYVANGLAVKNSRHCYEPLKDCSTFWYCIFSLYSRY